MNDISALVAQGIIVPCALLGKITAEMHIRQESAGGGFPLRLVCRGETGRDRYGADGVAVLPDGEGLIPLVHQDGIMRRGGNGLQIPSREPGGQKLSVIIVGGSDLGPAVFKGKNFQPLGADADEADGLAAQARGFIYLEAEGRPGVIDDDGGLHHDFPDFRIGHTALRKHRAGDGNRRGFGGRFLHGEGKGVAEIRVFLRIQMHRILAGGDLLTVRTFSVPAENVPVRVFHQGAFGADDVAFAVQDIHGHDAGIRHPAFHKPVFPLVQIQVFGGGQRQGQGRSVTPNLEGGGSGVFLSVGGGEFGIQTVRPAHQQLTAGAAPVPGENVLPVGKGFAPVEPGIVQAVIEREEHFSCRGGLHRDFTMGISLYFLRDGQGEGGSGFLRPGGDGKEDQKQKNPQGQQKTVL